MGDEKTLSELIEDVVERCATTAEEIHRAIAELPLSVLERLELFEKTASEVRKVQDSSIGAIYDLIRDVNHKVAQLSGELLEKRQKTEESD